VVFASLTPEERARYEKGIEKIRRQLFRCYQPSDYFIIPNSERVIAVARSTRGLPSWVLWSSVTGFLTVAAIAFFAAWAVLSNTFCALLLLTTRPFRAGDYIEVLESGEKPGLRGTVTAIHLIYTTLTENEPGAASSVLQVPNSLFFQRIVRRMSTPPANQSHL